MSHPYGEQPEPANPAPAAVPQQPSAPEVEQASAPIPAAGSPAQPYSSPPSHPAAAPAQPYAPPSHPAAAPAQPYPAPAQQYSAPGQPAPTPQQPGAPAFAATQPTGEPVTAQSNPTQAVPVVNPAQPSAYQIGTAAVPGPDAPVSATPGYAPTSATPYAYGYGAPAEPRKKRTGMIVLSIATAVLVLIAAGMATLFFVERTQRTAADNKIAEQAAVIAENKKKIEDLDDKLKTAKEEAAQFEQELTGAKNKTDEVTKEREALANCFRAIEDFARSQTSANEKELEKACDEASKYY